MRVRFSFVATTTLGLLASACAFLPNGSYFRPSYDGIGARLEKGECDGAVGRKEILSIKGPANSELAANLSVIKQGRRGPVHLVGSLYLHAKEGTRITMSADSMEVTVREPWGTNSFVRLRKTGHDTVFARVLRGDQPHGSEVLLEFRVPMNPTDPLAREPQQVVVQVPSMTVLDGAGMVSPFAPGRITFFHRSAGWYYTPFNC